MKRILCILLCLLLLPCAQAEADNSIEFTSHYERFTVSLPEGSVHYSIHDAARMTGSTPASLRFNEVDYFGIGTDERINMQAMSTPYGSLFRSDMLESGASMVDSFIASYVSFGYPEETLDVAMETIGAYPFVRVDLVDDPSAISEYYTYGSTGTEFCFAFLGTTAEEERAILSTLQLAEPTEIVADYTKKAGRNQLSKKLRKNDETPAETAPDETFTSNFERYTLSLPYGSAHYSFDATANHFGMSESELTQSMLDCYSFDRGNSVDMVSLITEGMDIQPSDMTKYRLELLSNSRKFYEELDYIDQNSLELTIVSVGDRKFIRVNGILLNSDGRTKNFLDYYTYDESGTEFYFQFYDIASADAENILKTLTLLPPQAKTSGNLADRALQHKSERADSQKKSPESTDAAEDERYAIDIPSGMIRYPDSMAQDLLASAVQSLKAAGGNTGEMEAKLAQGLEYHVYSTLSGSRTIEILISDLPDHTREELDNNDPQVIELSRQSIADQLFDPDDFLIAIETVGKYPHQVTEGVVNGILYSEFCTVTYDGIQYNVSFHGFTPEEARTIMETFYINE